MQWLYITLKILLNLGGMRNKKVLSTVVASTLVATTMAMPVMAAGGKVDVNVSTKDAVIRVEVPTKLEIAVDQFESVDSGSQIYSEAFTMKNKSGVAVKVGVNSVASTGTAAFVETVAAVDASTATTGEAWMAVAAQTEADGYGVDELSKLTEISPNVATFDATNKNAAQTYYLEKGTGDVEYKIITPAAAGDVGDLSYAQFYKLTAVTLTGGSEPTDLDAAIAASDVYVKPAGSTDDTLELVKKGTSYTWVTGMAAYTAASNAVEASATTTDPYVYAGSKDVGGEAAFRFVGKLSEAKTGAWTGADIGKIAINYTIDGVTASTYAEVAKDCTYGLYTAPAAPSIATTDYTVDPESDTEIAVNLGAASTGAKGVKAVLWEGENLINSDSDAKYENGKVIIDASVGKYFDQQNLLPATLTIVFDMNDVDAEPVSIDVTLKK